MGGERGFRVSRNRYEQRKREEGRRKRDTGKDNSGEKPEGAEQIGRQQCTLMEQEGNPDLDAWRADGTWMSEL